MDAWCLMVLIASLDGTEILRTSREGSWSAADVLAAGTDAGDELKAKAQISLQAAFRKCRAAVRGHL